MDMSTRGVDKTRGFSRKPRFESRGRGQLNTSTGLDTGFIWVTRTESTTINYNLSNVSIRNKYLLSTPLSKRFTSHSGMPFTRVPCDPKTFVDPWEAFF